MSDQSLTRAPNRQMELAAAIRERGNTPHEDLKRSSAHTCTAPREIREEIGFPGEIREEIGNQASIEDQITEEVVAKVSPEDKSTEVSLLRDQNIQEALATTESLTKNSKIRRKLGIK